MRIGNALFYGNFVFILNIYISETGETNMF